MKISQDLGTYKGKSNEKQWFHQNHICRQVADLDEKIEEIRNTLNSEEIGHQLKEKAEEVGKILHKVKIGANKGEYSECIWKNLHLFFVLKDYW